ncbi:MAG: RluA family pseudouridine synthase [Candidatus Adiutrix sp.]|jgi:23S rRNA pseudouridine1911/1915/1917 synthase|nr:RluA family pseudouridine synthase [Candidatus Adiutrix sp.]
MRPARLEDIFETPWPAPEVKKYLARLEPYVVGPATSSCQGGRLGDLVGQAAGVDEVEAARLIEFGSVWLDDRPCFDPDEPLARHSNFRINPPAYGPVRFYEAADRRIVFEDEDILVYDKEAGRPSQGVPHDAHNNVLAALGRLLRARGEACDLRLPHRLDADTSGLLLLAKNRESAAALGQSFQRGQVKKEYLCLSRGTKVPDGDFSVETYIAKEGRRYVNRAQGAGLQARTGFSLLAAEGRAGDEPAGILFLASPQTGRTHQIRLHLQWAGWPIMGDRLYGGYFPSPRLMLMASRLVFSHPRTGAEVRVSLEAADLKF